MCEYFLFFPTFILWLFLAILIFDSIETTLYYSLKWVAVLLNLNVTMTITRLRVVSLRWVSGIAIDGILLIFYGKDSFFNFHLRRL